MHTQLNAPLPNGRHASERPPPERLMDILASDAQFCAARAVPNGAGLGSRLIMGNLGVAFLGDLELRLNEASFERHLQGAR